MKKRLVSCLLALCMALALLPGTALAFPGAVEEEPVPPGAGSWEDALWITGEEFPEETPESFEPSGTGLPFDWDDPIPEFVPGVVEDDEELYYPDYGLLGSLLGEELPESYDTRGTTQTATKNQGANGLCWTFGSLAALEAQLKMLGYGEQDLSELHMGYATSSWNGNDQQGIAGREPSGGGNRNYSSSYLMRGTDLSGAVDEASDPYITTKLEGRELDISRVKEKTWQAQNILFLTNGRDEAAFDTIKQAVMTYGGVGASILWKGQTTATDGTNQPFYNSETHAYCYDWEKDSGASSSDSNHAVEIAGWDDNYPRENFTALARPENNGAWLIKNSWGKNWGDGGYAWVSYEDTNFPQRAYCFDGVKPYDPGEIVYETDYIMGTSYGYSSAGERYYAKAFSKETDGDEELSAVRIFLSSPYASVQVGCVPDLPGETLSGYTFASLGGDTSDAGTFFPGWYTIELDTPIRITGTRFAVAVRITAPSTEQGGSGIWIGADKQNPLDGAQVFASGNGRSWGASEINYCIKAVTEPVGSRGRGQAIVDKAADSLRWALIRGENESQSAVRTGLNLPTRFKDAYVTWTSSDPGVIAENGTVTRPLAYSDQAVTLTANLSSNGAGKSVTFHLTVPHILPGDQGDVDGVANAITWASIQGENANWNNVTVKLNITPSGTLSNGVTVTWTSSDTALIDTDGTVTIPRFDKNNTAVLTAVVTKGEAEREVSFTLTVPNDPETDQARFDAAKEWILGDYYRWWDLIRGENSNGGQIRTDLVIPAAVTIPTETGGSFTIGLAPEAGARRKEGGIQVPWGVVTDTGRVTRPDYGEPDSKGLFFLRLSMGNGSYQSIGTSWYLTVLSYKGAITAAPLEDVTAPPEQGAVLRAAVLSTEGDPGRLQYQWYMADDANGTNPRVIPGGTSDQLRISSLDGSESTGCFLCEISAPDAAPVRTNAARVTLLPGYPAAYVSASDPRRVQAYHLPLADAASVYAARYDANGRMTGLTGSVAVSGNEVRFGSAVDRGWRLFCLDGENAPLCEALVIS